MYDNNDDYYNDDNYDYDYYDNYDYDDLYDEDENIDMSNMELRQQDNMIDPQIQRPPFGPPMDQTPPFGPPMGQTPPFGPSMGQTPPFGPPMGQTPGPSSQFRPPFMPPFGRPDQFQRFRRCMYRISFITLNNGSRFWFYPTDIRRQRLVGFRWRRNRWEPYSIETFRILRINCD